MACNGRRDFCAGLPDASKAAAFAWRLKPARPAETKVTISACKSCLWTKDVENRAEHPHFKIIGQLNPRVNVDGVERLLSFSFPMLALDPNKLMATQGPSNI